MIRQTVRVCITPKDCTKKTMFSFYLRVFSVDKQSFYQCVVHLNFESP